MLQLFTRLLLLLFFLVIAPATVWAEPLFGPQEFTTNWMGYVISWQSFDAPAKGKGNLLIDKLTPDKKLRTGHILLNNKHYSLRRFLKGMDTELTLPVPLRKKNRLLVLLGGERGAGVRIKITGRYRPVIQFSGEPETIVEGESAVLSWTTQDADSASIEPGIGPVALSGSVSVTPATTTTYILTAVGKAGISTAQTTVSVLPRPPTVGISAEPEALISGDSATLSWQTEGADTVSIDQGIGQVAASGSVTVSPSETTTYTITATNAGGSISASVMVKVVPVAIIITSPKEQEIIQGPTVLVHGRVETAARYVEVGINGRRALVHSKEFFINDLPLEPGDNVITVQVTDSDRNHAQAEMTVGPGRW